MERPRADGQRPFNPLRSLSGASSAALDVMKLALTLLPSICLTAGCYTPHQASYDFFIRENVTVGVQVAEARTNMENKGFQCVDPKRSAKLLLQDGATVRACARQRSGFLYGYLERFEMSVDTQGQVSEVASGLVASSGL